ncbi:MAG: Gfo/Idh/MocA family oxidoreductase [Defluviitaleaceae bacterium]|nr:Gfo/Idh/MocA family oxidoreductase [Defluviitaleaceae bacterium]
MKTINVGIVGFGFMGKTHTYGYKTMPIYYDRLPFRINLRGVCDSVEETASNAKEELGFAYATTNPLEIFNDPDIDVVDICTPNIFHKEGILAAVSAGKHIYCDKPLAANLDEAEEILNAVKNADCINQMALQYRFLPATLRAKQLINEKKIGKILSFRAVYLHSGSINPNKPIGWKQDKNFGGGGVLLDLGSHVIDLMYWLLGEYDSVIAETRVLYGKRPDKNGILIDINADDLALLTVRMKDGSIGTIEASKIATGTNDELRFEIHGDKGAVSFNLMEPNWLCYYDNQEPEAPLGGSKGYTKIECVQRFEKPGGLFPGPKFSIGWIRGHVHSLYNFIDNVYKNTAASPSFQEGAYVQKVMESAYVSAQTHQWIKIN